MSEQGGLFDAPAPRPARRAETRSQSLRRRQDSAILTRMHPLSVVLGPLRLHPDVAAVDVETRTVEGPTCGDCALRKYLGGHARAFPKCFAYERVRPRVTYGEGTDVRAWWPACPDYEPKEQG